jgi:hypothetical protein
LQRSGLSGALLRRWYLAIAGLALTLALCVEVTRIVPPTYQVAGSVVLLPPKAVYRDSGNPYLALGGLGAAVSVLSLSMADADTFAALRAQGSTGTYSVTADQASAGPVLLVVAQAKSSSGALRTLQLVMSQLPKTLTRIQESVGTRPTDMITTSVVTEKKEADKVRKGQIRALLVAGTAGIALTLFMTALLDVWLERRRRTRSRRGGTRPDGTVADAVEGQTTDDPTVSSRLSSHDWEHPPAGRASLAGGSGELGSDAIPYGPG